MCPHCEKPLYGSASRGKLGKYYPAYQCNKRGHYFRVSNKVFDQTIKSFIENLSITPEYIENLKKLVLEIWNQRHDEIQKEYESIDIKILELKTSTKTIVDKIKFLSSSTAIKYLEEEILQHEKEIAKLEKCKQSKHENDVDMNVIMEKLGYFLEHLEELVLSGSNLL